MYDEVSHPTPAFIPLQLKIAAIAQIAANITGAYWPSKRYTTAVQRACKNDRALRAQRNGLLLANRFFKIAPES
jgi:hypothetical protein